MTVQNTIKTKTFFDVFSVSVKGKESFIHTFDKDSSMLNVYKNKSEYAIKKRILKAKRIKKTDSFVIDSKRWFDKVNGNTYHSVKIFLNGSEIAYIPFEYGYGNHYEQTAREKLFELGYFLTESKDESRKLFINYFYENRKQFLYIVNDVSRRKDL